MPKNVMSRCVVRMLGTVLLTAGFVLPITATAGVANDAVVNAPTAKQKTANAKKITDQFFESIFQVFTNPVRDSKGRMKDSTSRLLLNMKKFDVSNTPDDFKTTWNKFIEYRQEELTIKEEWNKNAPSFPSKTESVKTGRRQTSAEILKQKERTKAYKVYITKRNTLRKKSAPTFKKMNQLFNKYSPGVITRLQKRFQAWEKKNMPAKTAKTSSRGHDRKTVEKTPK